MKFILKIVHSRFIDGSDTHFSFKIILLEKQVRVKVFSVLNLFGAIPNLYHIGFLFFFSFGKYLSDKVCSIGIFPIGVKLSIILVGFDPVQGLYLVL